MKILTYSYVSPGYDKKVDDGRLYVEPPKEISGRFSNTRMISRMVKALPHLFLDYSGYDACLWIDSNVVTDQGIEALLGHFPRSEHCAVFPHYERETIDEEIDVVNTYELDHPCLTAQHRGRQGRLAWTGILYRTFTPEVIEANNRWWAEISTKSSRDQLSFPYIFDGLIDYISEEIHDWKLLNHDRNQNF